MQDYQVTVEAVFDNERSDAVSTKKARLILTKKEDDGKYKIVNIAEFNTKETQWYFVIEALFESVDAPAQFFIVENYGGEIVDSGELSTSEMLELMWQKKVSDKLMAGYI